MHFHCILYFLNKVLVLLQFLCEYRSNEKFTETAVLEYILLITWYLNFSFFLEFLIHNSVASLKDVKKQGRYFFFHFLIYNLFLHFRFLLPPFEEEFWKNTIKWIKTDHKQRIFGYWAKAKEENAPCLWVMISTDQRHLIRAWILSICVHWFFYSASKISWMSCLY